MISTFLFILILLSQPLNLILSRIRDHLSKEVALLIEVSLFAVFLRLRLFSGLSTDAHNGLVRALEEHVRLDWSDGFQGVFGKIYVIVPCPMFVPAWSFRDGAAR